MAGGRILEDFGRVIFSMISLYGKPSVYADR
jgi:hypothetical protein